MTSGFPSRTVPYLVESAEIAKRIGDDQMLLLPLFFGTWTLVDRDPAAAVEALERSSTSPAGTTSSMSSATPSSTGIALARLGRFDEARADIARGARYRAAHHIAGQARRHSYRRLRRSTTWASSRKEWSMRAWARKWPTARTASNAPARAIHARQGPARAAQARRCADRVRQVAEIAGCGLRGICRYMNAIKASAARGVRGRDDLGGRIAAHCAEQRALGDDEFGAATRRQASRRRAPQAREERRSGPLLDSAIDLLPHARMRPYLAGALELAGTLYEQSASRMRPRPREAAPLRDLHRRASVGGAVAA